MTPTPAILPSDTNQHLSTSEILLEKILVAIDFSAQSPQVLKTAIAIGNCFGSELILVSAVTPNVYGTELVPIEAFEVNLEIANTRMTELIASAPALATIKHREIVTYASPLGLIQQVAKDEKIDLIVAGSHGASGLTRVVLGSVAESILQNVSCPVMIVGPQSAFANHPFRSILYATALDAGGLRGAQYATSLAERFHSQLTLLHVVEPDRKSESAEPYLRALLERLLPPDLNTYCKARVHVEYGSAGDTISRVARSECVSLIVAGVRENTRMPGHSTRSTLSQVIREAQCPVLCVRHHLV